MDYQMFRRRYVIDKLRTDVAQYEVAHDALRAASSVQSGQIAAPQNGYGYYWMPSNRGDRRAKALFERHYSCDGKRKRSSFVAPGEAMVLMTSTCDALFVWRYSIYREDEQQGVNCAVFRNESEVLSSVLIEEAMTLAWARWQSARLFTFVNPKRIRSTNPGYCFLRAGWKKCGETKGKLLILEALP